jgi:hypothetical protein
LWRDVGLVQADSRDLRLEKQRAPSLSGTTYLNYMTSN